MTTISSSLTFNATATLADVAQSIEQDLKAKGVEGKIDQNALVLTRFANQDGTFTVFYQYPLDPPQNTPSGSLNDASNKLDGFVDLGAILALFHEVALEQRDAARAGRQAQLNIQVAQLENAAQDLRDSAVAAFVGAMVMGALSIAGGIVSVAGAMKAGTQAEAGLKQSKTATELSSKMTPPKPEVQAPKPEVQAPKPEVQAPKPEVQAPKPEVQAPKPEVQAPKPEVQAPKPEVQAPKSESLPPDFPPKPTTAPPKPDVTLEIQSRNQMATNLSQLSQTTLGKFQGWSSLASSVGGVGKGIGDFIAGQEQANSKEDEARATKAGGQRDELIAYQNEAQQLMADIRQMLQQITQNQMETARAILRV